MIVTLHATTKIITLITKDGSVEARIWEGTTGDGVPVHAFITRLAVRENLDPSTYAAFERELVEQAKPASPDVAKYPPRLVLNPQG